MLCTSLHLIDPQAYFFPKPHPEDVVAGDDDEEYSDCEEHQRFIPDEHGVEHTMSGRVVMMVRLEFIPAKGRYVAQWYLPDRRIDIPDELCIYKASEHLVEFMKSPPNMKIGTVGVCVCPDHQHPYSPACVAHHNIRCVPDVNGRLVLARYPLPALSGGSHAIVYITRP